jgi:4-amino-4-deoxy-L-arabinose transferase-like glycosyltransferase
MRVARTANPGALVHLLDQIDGTRAPLHPLALQAWLRLFGTSEASARSLSAVCGILTVLLVWVLGLRLFDDRAGRWAAWLAAVCPPLVYYSREVRMYSWLVMLTCLSWLVFLSFRHRAGLRLKVLYGLLLAALIYSHPLGLFMVAAHALAYLLLGPRLALSLRSWLLIQLAVFVSIAPWLPRYLDHGTDYPLPRYAIRYLLAAPIEYTGGNSLVLPACGLIIALGLCSLEDRRLRLNRPSEGLVLLVWLVVPPMLMFAYSWLERPIFGPARYHLFIAPAYLLLLGQGLSRLRLILRWTVAVLFLYLSLSLIADDVYSQVVKADWHGLALWLNHKTTDADTTAPHGPVTLLVHPSDDRFPRDQLEAARYYLTPPHRVLLAAETSETEPSAAEDRPRLDVFCLSAGEVRAGIRTLSETRFEAPVWHRTATDFHHGVPTLRGLILRR